MKSSKITNAVMGFVAAVGGIGSVPASAQSYSQQRGVPHAQDAQSNCEPLSEQTAMPPRAAGARESILPGYGITLAMSRESHMDVYIPNGDQDVRVVSIERNGVVRDYAAGVICAPGSPEAQRYITDLRGGLQSFVENQRADVLNNRYNSLILTDFLNYVVSGVARGTNSRSTNIGRNILGAISDTGFNIARQRGQLRDSAVMVQTVQEVNQYNLFLQAAERTGELGARRYAAEIDAAREIAEGDQVVQDEIARRCAKARSARVPYTPAFCRR